jgi:glycosyltransferase involved in cell wall biosynthesis
MKVLVIHNYYNFHGGEDQVFERECDLLAEENEVQTLVFQNYAGFLGLIQFIASIWNIFSRNAIQKKIKEFTPDVIHIHNWHFAAGPLIIRAAKKLGVPIVVTLHNYRLLCPSGTLMFKDQIFTESLKQGFPWAAVRKKAYKNSVGLTFWLAFIVWTHKVLGTWKMVDKYIVLTNFAKQLILTSQFSIPESRLVIKPNFVLSTGLEWQVESRKFLFVGRLSEEKGIAVLLDTFSRINHELHIAGTGPLKNRVVEAANGYSNIHYLGPLNRIQVLEEMRTSTALLFPSIWYETFGLVVIEAFEMGLPVIASDIGSASELILNDVNGLHFEAGDSYSLQRSIDYWAGLSAIEHQRFGDRARGICNNLYSAESNKAQLHTIYKSILL